MAYKPFLPQLLKIENSGATGATGATESMNMPNVASVASVVPRQNSKKVSGVASVASVVRVFQKIGIVEFYDLGRLIDVTGEPAFWPYDTWIEFEERAAILEFDGGYSREQAECLALVELGLSIDGDIHDENF